MHYTRGRFRFTEGKPMSKKWMLIAGGGAVVIIVVIAVLFMMPRKTSAPITVSTGAASSSGTSTEGIPGMSKKSPGTTATSTSKKSPGTTATSTSKKTPGTNSSLPALKPFPTMPESKLAGRKASSPAAAGKTLAPLTQAPPLTIAALKPGLVPDGAQYQITMRPYGIGPAIAFGSRVAIRVDSITPVASAPTNSHFANGNFLVVVNTTDGGTVTKGGTYAATLTFRSDGSKLLPILSKVTAK